VLDLDNLAVGLQNTIFITFIGRRIYDEQYAAQARS